MRTRCNFKRVCNSYPDDKRPLNIRIRHMLFQGVPLGENPDVKHDFEDSSHGTDCWFVDPESDIHMDVFDKMEHAHYLSHYNAIRALEKESTSDTISSDTASSEPATISE